MIQIAFEFLFYLFKMTIETLYSYKLQQLCDCIESNLEQENNLDVYNGDILSVRIEQSKRRCEIYE